MTATTINNPTSRYKKTVYALLSYGIPIIAILGLYLLFNETAWAMDDEKIIAQVEKTVGKGSVAQKVLGGAGFVGSGVMALMGQIKMALVTLFSVAGMFVAYNSKAFFG